MSNVDSSHPYIKFAIDQGEYIQKEKYYGDKGLALELLIDLLNTFDPKDRNEEWTNLENEAVKTLETRNSISESDAIVLKQKLMIFDFKSLKTYRDLWSGMWTLLWRCGKLYDRTYQGIDLKSIDFSKAEEY